MKPVRTIESGTFGRFRRRASQPPPKVVRECLVLTDPTDCLLDAYDCVALRAYENYLAHGPRPGGELEDWLSAERQLLLGFQIDLHETEEFIYALASVPGATASQVSVGIESRWMVILVRQPARSFGREDCRARDSITIERALREAAQPGASPWPAKVVAKEKDGGPARQKCPASLASGAVRANSAAQQGTVAPRESVIPPPAVSDDRRAQSVCVLGLPAAVDSARSIAVLADGLLGIRMAKTHPSS
jgi:HSP20 family molecular chaperone IbpA